MRTVAIIALAALAGCGLFEGIEKATPATHLHNATSVYVVAVQTMTDLSKADLVSLEAMEQFEQIRVKAASLLEAAQASLDAGETVSFADLDSTLLSLQTIITIATKVLP